MTETKASIRKLIRTQRQNLSTSERQLAAKNCAQNIINSKILDGKNAIAFYLAQDNELDLSILLTYCLTNNHNNKKFYLPVLANTGNHLIFTEYNNLTKLKKNKYNIDEPVQDQNNCINPNELDLVFLPLVAFTKSGQRLGMGGGYYDQTFAFLANSLNNNNESNKITKPILMGVAYDFQCVNYLPNKIWDINLYGIATESTVFNF